MPDKKRVLIVDDDPDISRLLQFAFASEGYEASVAATGPAGIEMALSQRPDLAIVDVMLPEVDGFEIVRRIRATPTLSHILIVMLTARAEVKDRLAGFEVGADDYVIKPVVIEELMARVKALFARAGTSPEAGAPQGRDEGQVWTLFSLKGGVGASSLAVNIAIALRQDWADSVAIADLNQDGSAIEGMLNLAPSSKQASIVGLSPSDWDESFVRQLLKQHQSQLDVLTLSISQPLDGDILTPASARRIVILLAEMFQFVVIDTSSVLSDLNCGVLELSDLIMILLTPDINSWKAAARALSALKSLNVPLEKTVLVYNRTFPNNGLAPNQAESFFHLSLASNIPYGGPAFLSSVNIGVPIVLQRPTDATSLAIKELTKKLMTDKQSLVRPDQDKGQKAMSRARSRFAAT